MIRKLLSRVLRGERLTREEASDAVRSMVRGESDPVPIAALLTALAQRGETAEELLGAAEALRAEAVPFPPVGGPLLDTCGTGGDSSGSFNVSTAVALVAAGAGARVAKHGNRSVSSRCGSADVLEALGAAVEIGPRGALRALNETGFCFLYARRFHPSMRRVAAVREALGVRTLFNWIGPLANPARATHQLLGIPDRSRLEPMARVLGRLGVTRALVVHGAGGLDELSLEPGNEALLVSGGDVTPVTIEAPALGLAPAPPASIRGGDAGENARIIRRVLEGETGPRRDAVLLNAAAAVWVAGVAASLEEGVRLAQRSLDSGAAARTLERYVAVARDCGED
jgi:anthranilate phosphoribosyltransferase